VTAREVVVKVHGKGEASFEVEDDDLERATARLVSFAGVVPRAGVTWYTRTPWRRPPRVTG
jgi:hypothetical protein